MNSLTRLGVGVGSFLVAITLRRWVKTIYTIVFLIDPQGRFVLLRRANLGKGPHLDGVVGPVGGKVKPHERNIFAAAAREVKEEVGVYLSKLFLKGVVFIGSPSAALFYLVGFISSVEGMIEASREGEILVGSLEEILLGQDVPPNLPLALKILAKRKLFIGFMRSDFEPEFPWWRIGRSTLLMISQGLVGEHPPEGLSTFP